MQWYVVKSGSNGITIAASFHGFHNIFLNLDNIVDTALAT